MRPLLHELQIFGMLCFFLGMMACSLFEESIAEPWNESILSETHSNSEAEDVISHSKWNDVLSIIVTEQGRVEYPLLFKPKIKENFISYLKLLEAPIPKKLSRRAALSYWINAYNALTVRHVLRYPKLKSVATAVAGAERYHFFKQAVHLVAGKLRSLDEIEHRIIRPTFRDARVHVALNCASVSCPKLPVRAFTAQTVDLMLDQLSIDFVNDPSRNVVNKTHLELSNIFNWYREDFRVASGHHSSNLSSDLTGVREFIRRYSTLEQSPSAAMSFKPYDWSLNGPPPQSEWDEQ